MTLLADDQWVIQRIFDHIDKKTTDLGEASWREPVENYRSEARFAAELELVLRRSSTPFCPSAALPEIGSYLARNAAGTPLLAIRGRDGKARAFRNACRHRGMQLAEGAGCKKAFVCRYHAWTYGLDGSLRGVPHEYGFPGLDKSARGLVPVETIEMHGLIFVTQNGSIQTDPRVIELPDFFKPPQSLFATFEQDVAANWKIVAEGFLEGYHIHSTHRDTFFPIQFDNLNVVETFGRNSRVAFPYRRIGKLRDVPATQRSVDRMLTYVYHVFPNVMVATFPTNTTMIVLEPQAVDRTRIINYSLTIGDSSEPADQESLDRGREFVATGTAEDREVACAIQRGLSTNANEYFEFGLFEGAIGHFHRSLHATIDGTE